ncbi:transferrin-binding protein-like solute binding protein [Altererythrobacter sp. Z27]|uniref:transferrin-binding protein-like solute binding protein n=1 Tax=Altererythrobacter sp. Z27 TaxID=3461147 RepID=UPI004044C9FD
MMSKGRTILSLTSTSLLLASCRSEGAPPVVSVPPPSPSPTPTPTPTPSPTPTSFQPVPARIFVEPLYNEQLDLLGKGWQFNYQIGTGEVSNQRISEDLSISYDSETATYLVTAPLAGSGTIMQNGDYRKWTFEPSFPADPSIKSPSSYCCNSLDISAPGLSDSLYTYMSLVHLFASNALNANTNTTAYGAFVLIQPTKPGEVPITGTATYSGNLVGYFSGDAGATWLQGKSRFDFDFANATLAGDLTIAMACLMGCSYAPVVYTLTETKFTTGSINFSGSLASSGTASNGHFNGTFAGPNAVEMAAQFELPFYNPEWQKWLTASGAILGKRD